MAHHGLDATAGRHAAQGTHGAGAMGSGGTCVREKQLNAEGVGQGRCGSIESALGGCGGG
jgi:hypothetical protein